MSFGLRSICFILKILGVVPFGSHDKGPWINLIFSLYFNTLWVVLCSSQIILVSGLVNILLNFEPEGKRSSLRIFLIHFPYFMWLLLIFSMLYYLRSYLKTMITYLSKILDKFSEHKNNTEGKVIVLFCVLLNIMTIFQAFFISMIEGLDSVFSICNYLTGLCELVETTICILFCLVIHKISLLLKCNIEIKPVSGKPSLLKKKSNSNNFVNYSQTKSENIKQRQKMYKQIIFLEDIASLLFDYMGLPISLIFIIDLVYLLVDVVKVAIFETFTLYNVTDMVKVTLRLGLICHCADILRRQVRVT